MDQSLLTDGRDVEALSGLSTSTDHKVYGNNKVGSPRVVTGELGDLERFVNERRRPRSRH